MPVFVEGLNAYVSGLEKAGADVEELKDAMEAVATEATSVMRPHIPVRSGKLRDSARPNRAKGKAIVTVGKASTPYARVIQYGYPARGIKPAHYVEKTDAVMDTRATQILEDGWSAILRKNGLA